MTYCQLLLPTKAAEPKNSKSVLKLEKSTVEKSRFRNIHTNIFILSCYSDLEVHCGIIFWVLFLDYCDHFFWKFSKSYLLFNHFISNIDLIWFNLSISCNVIESIGQSIGLACTACIVLYFFRRRMHRLFVSNISLRICSGCSAMNELMPIE